MLADLLVATALALIFLLLGWLWGRATSSGKPLSRFKKELLTFAFVFVLGMGYIMALVSDLRWKRALLFPAIACWAASVAGVVWYRHRPRRSNSSPG